MWGPRPDNVVWSTVSYLSTNGFTPIELAEFNFRHDTRDPRFTQPCDISLVVQHKLFSILLNYFKEWHILTAYFVSIMLPNVAKLVCFDKPKLNS